MYCNCIKGEYDLIKVKVNLPEDEKILVDKMTEVIGEILIKKLNKEEMKEFIDILQKDDGKIHL